MKEQACPVLTGKTVNLEHRAWRSAYTHTHSQRELGRGSHSTKGLQDLENKDHAFGHLNQGKWRLWWGSGVVGWGWSIFPGESQPVSSAVMGYESLGTQVHTTHGQCHGRSPDDPQRCGWTGHWDLMRAGCTSATRFGEL